MKKSILLLWLVFGIFGSAWAGDFLATGLTNPGEKWRTFATTGMSVTINSYGEFIEIEIQSRNRMVRNQWGSVPSSQPFEVRIPFALPQTAVLTSAGIFDGNQWRDARSVGVLKAEDIYRRTPKSDMRLLLRKVIRHYWDGGQYARYELLISPVFRYTDFVFRVKYVMPVTPGLWEMRMQFGLDSFLEDCPTSHCTHPVSFYFLDHDFPENQPKFFLGVHYPGQYKFAKKGGMWTVSVPRGEIRQYSNIGVRWFRSLSKGPELRLFENADGKYYTLMLAPPLQTNEQKARHVLIVYDLGDHVSVGFSRSQLIAAFKVMASSGLFDQDSVNVLLTDFIPKTLREHFVQATDQMVNQLFKEIQQAPEPHLSTLPQLLRAAKDYFNRENVPGEIWLITNATKHSKPVSVANEIIDLSLRQLKLPVQFKIFDCSDWSWTHSIWINGHAYYGNDYLYENLARLSKGAVVKLRNLAVWQLLDALGNVFFPAVDAVEVDALPRGGFHESRFLFNNGRSHFPIAWPYMELGRYEGNLPFSVDYFGKVDGHLYKHTVAITDTFNTPRPDLLAIMWHAYHVENLLKEPQSNVTISEIGRIATKYHFLSPYNGFVIPGPSGLVAFKRLVESDTLQPEEPETTSLPGRFSLAAFPNPFNLNTTVHLSFSALQKATVARVKIYDLLGKQVRSYRFDLPQAASTVQFRWDGRSNDGEILPSGVYLIVGVIGHLRKRIKLTLLK